MMFKVVCDFVDLQDDKNRYNVGDEYPRVGLEVSEERIDELSGRNNLFGRPLIEKVYNEDVEDESEGVEYPDELQAFEEVMPAPEDVPLEAEVADSQKKKEKKTK